MGCVTFVFFASCSLVFAQKSVQNGINQFTNKLVRNIERGNPSSNFVLSPLSLHSTFSQVLIGAGGRTQAELEAVLGVTRSKRLVDQYAQISSTIPALKTANILALNKGFTPAKGFVQFLKDGFGSEVKEYDMVNNKRRAVSEINRIVATHTSNKILDLLSSEDINENTKMLLINAVYFKENWKTAFNPLDSFSSDFQTPALGNVMTKYMNIEMEARHTETENLEILELPYEDKSTSMLFFLPKKGKSSNNIMDSVARYPLNSLKSVRTSSVVIIIPKFKITFETKLKQEMLKIGMKELFTDNANFTYISNQPLQVSDGIHKAFIEVNEEGTEAAAATAVLFGTRSGGNTKKRFFANRPFMFMVYDSVNNIPIFIGKITNPSNPNVNGKALNQPRKVQVASQVKQTQTTKTPQSVKLINPIQQNMKDKCNTYKDSIGVAVYNINECKRRENSFRFFQKYQAACSASQDIYNNFLSANCGSSWCEYAAQNYITWQQKYRAGCKAANSGFKKTCIKLSYDLMVVRFLNCGF